jgi:hypothetical protein
MALTAFGFAAGKTEMEEGQQPLWLAISEPVLKNIEKDK